MNFSEKYCNNKAYLKLEKLVASDKVDVVSFDVFDTLVVRPFWEPTDLFVLMEEDVRRQFKIQADIDFKKFRVQAEARARKIHPELEDITLDQIYHELGALLKWGDERLDWIKAREIELEKRFCRPRLSARRLYESAMKAGKRVIAVSDMYLPKTTVMAILRICGYAFDVADVFLSCDIGKTKTTGTLFKHVAGILAIKPRCIVHIGDTLASDIRSAQQAGWCAVHYQKTTQIFAMGAKDRLGRSTAFGAVFGGVFGQVDGGSAFAFLGIRCMVALVANRLCDDPFADIGDKGYFNADPFVFGYFALGMHLLAFTDWIADNVRRLGLTGLHFLARDGYLPMRAYRELYGDRPDAVKFDVWNINRRVANQLKLRSADDFNALASPGRSFSPRTESFIGLFKGVLDERKLSVFKAEVLKRFPPRTFNDEDETVRLVAYFRDEVFPKYSDQLQIYRGKVLDFFRARLFGGHDATVDVGYSCRSETILAQSGIRLTPLYLHLYTDLGLTRSASEKLDVQMFHGYRPIITGTIRELFFSEVTASCEYYADTGSGFGPVFAKALAINEHAGEIIRTAQESALEFVRDWKNTFNGEWQALAYRHQDASLPFDCLLTYSYPSDHRMFDGFIFDDDMGWDSQSPVKFWDYFTASTLRSVRRGPMMVAAAYGLYGKILWPFTVFERWFWTKFPRNSATWMLAKSVLIGARNIKVSPLRFLKGSLPFGLYVRNCRRRSVPIMKEYETVFGSLPRIVKNLLPGGFVRYWADQKLWAASRGETVEKGRT